jgi:hypothetical protein
LVNYIKMAQTAPKRTAPNPTDTTFTPPHPPSQPIPGDQAESARALETAISILASLTKEQSDENPLVRAIAALAAVVQAQQQQVTFLINNQTNMFNKINKLLDKLEGQPPPPPIATSPTSDDAEKRAHCVVISKVTESAESRASDRVKEDRAVVEQLLDKCDVECTPVQVYRMGAKNQSVPRLLKVELPTKRHVREFLRNKSNLKRDNQFANVFIRPSQSLAERQTYKKLLDNKIKLNRENPDHKYVIYAGVVMKAEEVPAFKANKTSS